MYLLSSLCARLSTLIIPIFTCHDIPFAYLLIRKTEYDVSRRFIERHSHELFISGRCMTWHICFFKMVSMVLVLFSLGQSYMKIIQ